MWPSGRMATTSQGWSQYSEVRRNSGPRPLLRREALSRTKAPNTKKSGTSTGTLDQRLHKAAAARSVAPRTIYRWPERFRRIAQLPSLLGFRPGPPHPGWRCGALWWAYALMAQGHPATKLRRDPRDPRDPRDRQQRFLRGRTPAWMPGPLTTSPIGGST